MANIGKIFNLLRLNQITNITRITPSVCLTYRKFTVLSSACTKLTIITPPTRQPNRLQSETGDKFREREEQKEREYNEAQRVEALEKVEQQRDSDDQAKYTEMRNQILKASLELVPTYGWTRQCIVKGAENLGYPGVVHGMFSNGPIELVQYFYADSNRKLVDILKGKTENAEGISDGQSKSVIVSKKPEAPVEFVKEAIKCRLLMLEPYIKTWPQAIALMSLPQNAPNSLANLLTLVDDICYHSGDRSVDFGWYIRRVGLATIYKVTELYMIQDTSPNYAKTWEFLDRRVEDGVYIHTFIDTSDEASKNVQQVLGTAFETARNMLGMNFNRR